MNKRQALPHEKLQQAITLHQQGRLAEAHAKYQEILDIQPRHFDALHLLGVLCAQTQNPQRAVDLIGKAIDINPRHAIAHRDRGAALHVMGQWEAALASYDQAVAIKPDYADAYFCRASVLRDLKRYEAAIASLDQTIGHSPGRADAYFYRGVTLSEVANFDAALASYDQAIALKGDFAEAYCNRGNALMELKQLDAALASYDQAIAITPNFALAHSNRGNVLKELQRFDAALACYDQAIALQADYAVAYFNRGVLLHELRRLQPALASYNEAIALRADYAEARYHRSLLLLLMGDFEQGFIDHEWRWQDTYGTNILDRRNFTQPLWLGESALAGQTILLHTEQGLGDTFQFCRYASVIAALGARVILEVPSPLMTVLGNLEGVSQLLPRGSELPRFDYQCPLLSLPLAVKTRLDTIPATTPYLHSDPTKVAEWKTRLGEKKQRRIGLLWSGNPRNRNDHNRSFLLAELLPYLPREFQYVSLQKELREPDRQTLERHPWILNFAEALADFSDTAALIDCLDLVLSVDTSVAHLSGGLGQKTWVLLTFAADWRWLLTGTDCPWYPTATLYRQRRRGDWTGVFEQVRADLMGAPRALVSSAAS